MVRVPTFAITLAMLAACATWAAPSAVSERGQAVSRPPSRAAQAAFMEDLSRRTFTYFWDTTDTKRCLAPDRWPSNPFSSIAATGFALTAYGVGTERGYITRAAAAERTRDCLKFYWNAPQGPGRDGITGHKGFFYHFLRNDDGTRYRNTELSTVDSSLFLGGALFAQSYFDRADPVEAEIRDLTERIYRRVDWTWAQRNRTGTQARNLASSHGIAMGWKPERGWEPHDWVAYDEGMLVYVLALGSPTHPVGKDAWDQGWAVPLKQKWGSYQGQHYLQFEPLFGHQYSHVWVDFRGIREPFIASKGVDYFENSRRATLAHRAYGIANPNRWNGYGADTWGWTASDGPIGSRGKLRVNGAPRDFMTYSARGVSAVRVVDDGTIAPTAAGGSIPFAPKITIRALMAMRDRGDPRLYGRYGFKDSFNPSYTFADPGSRSGTVDPILGWVANDNLGIDQGPILAMLENHRSGLVWRVMRKNPHIVRGLKRIGFTGGWLNAKK